MARLIQLLLHCVARLPLRQLQRLGACLGVLTCYAAPRVTARIKSNLIASGTVGNYQDLDHVVKRVVQETGKGGLELAIAWCRSPEYIASLVVDCRGWEHVEAALAAGRGIVFVTPHLGSYDIAGRYLSHRLPFPLTAMYRPPKLTWLEPVMNSGRKRGNGRTAPATPAGVRILLKALKNGEATIVLPDQVPSSGEGVWAPFFGTPAYTMTLVPRLAQLKNVVVLYFAGERLADGKGFIVHIQPPTEPFDGDKEGDAARVNLAVESLIRHFPEQYLWSYNRFKCPAGVTPPGQKESE